MSRLRSTRNRAVTIGLIGLSVFLQQAPSIAAQREGIDCSQESLGLVPLTEMNGATYMGAEGGLYPEASNSIPADHQTLGMSLMNLVVPRDSSGQPAEEGTIGFMSVGVSTTSRDWEGFTTLVEADSDVNPRVVLVNGGISGRPLSRWLEPSDSPWRVLSERVTAAGLSPAQIQVAWVMMPDRPLPPPPFPERQEIYREQLQTVLRTLKAKYPNLQLAFLSSHQYAGYAIGEITEPGTGYEHGFGVKWTIESQIIGADNMNADPAQGPVTAPWIAWGPYTWADGVIPRADGLTWECDEFANDGHHPREEASLKLGGMLLQFFASDPTTAPWFLAEGVEPRPNTPTTAPATTTTSEPNTTSTSPTTTAARSTTTAPAAAEDPETAENTGSSTPWLPILGGGVAIVIVAFIAGAAYKDRTSRRR